MQLSRNLLYLQFCLDFLLNWTMFLGSKWQLTELNRLGFSLSYQDVSRCKQTVVVSEDINFYLKSVSDGSFSQWSADNVHRKVKMIDGKGSLHGMGVIVSTTGGRLDNTDSPVIYHVTNLQVQPRSQRENEYL